MKYTLAVLTHGSSDTLYECLASFDEMVTPAPTTRLIHKDPGAGFCGATRILWQKAVLVGNDYVFWLEHDFLFNRPVDLHELAQELDENQRLTQISLMRDPVSAPEITAGGLFEFLQGDSMWDKQSWGYIQTHYVITTNPSLMRSQFMAANRWPDYPNQCEGRFGVDLRERGFVAGVWGEGAPWVSHIGIRDGHGY